MGTRNLTCVIKDGNFRVAQYGQWDGYPDSAGRHILKFLSNPENIERLRSRLNDVQFITDAEYTRRIEVANIGETFVLGSPAHKRYKETFRWMNRDLGANILDALVTSTDQTIDLLDSKEFAHDSLFCEWAYVVDLDRNLLEVYKGFNHDANADAGVFANVPRLTKELKKSEPYYSVVLTKSYPFNNLPSGDVLVEECDPPEPEDSDE